MLATPAAHVASVPDCTPAHLTVTLGPSDGAAGTIYYTILFRNTGTSPCALRGYPGVSSVGGTDGHQIGAPARRQPVAHLRSMVLAAGRVRERDVRPDAGAELPEGALPAVPRRAACASTRRTCTRP